MARGRMFSLPLMLVAGILLLTSCGPRAQPMPKATPRPAASRPIPTRTARPTPTVTSTAAPGGRTLATLQAELTVEPCAPEDVSAYSDAVLPLADQHVHDAAEAKALAEIEDQEFIDAMYDRAVARRDQLRAIVPPDCARTSHIKMDNSFQLLIEVWDHIGEREYDLARRKLLFSYDELAGAAALLTELEAELAGR